MLSTSPLALPPLKERNHVALGADDVLSKGSRFTVPSGLGGVFTVIPTPKRADDGRQIFRVTNPDFEEMRIAYSPEQLADEVLKADEQLPRPAYGLPEAIALADHHHAKAIETARVLRALGANARS